jgi:predicted dehydrogenase
MEWLEGFRIHADFGSVLGDVSWPFYRQGAKVRVYNAKDHQYHTPACPDADPYERQIEAFAKAIVEDVPVSPNVVDGLACQRVLDAIYRSFTENKPVEINL